MTWLHIPPQYTSALATEGLSLPCDRGEYAPWLTLSGTATQRPSSWNGWRNRDWIKPLFGTTSQPLTANLGAAAWISSLPVSPASHSPQPGRVVDLTMTVGSGPQSQGLSLRYDPVSLCWRTCHQLFEQDYPLSSQTLPNSASMRNGDCTAQPTLEPLTDASVGGAWPTPTAGMIEGNGFKSKQFRGEPNLAGAAKTMWPTPAAHDAKMTGQIENGRNSAMLPEAAVMWPTPCARDAKGKPGPNAQMETLPGTASHQAVTTPQPGHDGSQKVDLNPWFVASLMGLPPDWLTHSTSAVTDWCHKQQQQQSDNSLSVAGGSYE